MSNKKKFSTVVIILILLAGNAFFALKYFVAQKELHQSQTILKNQETNKEILDFTKLFIEKILKAESEVDFETRLKLENAVRNLDNKEILENWTKFVDSKTESEAQKNVKDLLELLINKIKTK